jgi:hypothetical protein
VDIAKLMDTDYFLVKDGPEVLELIYINMPNPDYSNVKFEMMNL